MVTSPGTPVPTNDVGPREEAQVLTVEFFISSPPQGILLPVLNNCSCRSHSPNANIYVTLMRHCFFCSSFSLARAETSISVDPSFRPVDL